MHLNGKEDSMQRISVAMCTYNGGRYLQEQLESIALQSRLPMELVVCDDQSTDDTISILKRFQSEAPFTVKVVRNSQRLGSTQNFDQAIGLARGDLIALWHHRGFEPSTREEAEPMTSTSPLPS